LSKAPRQIITKIAQKIFALSLAKQQTNSYPLKKNKENPHEKAHKEPTAA
jgi:hypothetical protein